MTLPNYPATGIRSLFGEICLEIYVSTKKSQETADLYQNNTGINPQGNKHFQIYDKKWGTQYRIYFKESDSNIVHLNSIFRVLKNDVSYLQDFTHRINNPTLFWDLISNGCHLGLNT